MRAYRCVTILCIDIFPGYYRYSLTDKVLNFDMDINGLRHVDLVLELHMRQDKRVTIYTPKLYFAITSKPVAELSGELTSS